MREEYVSEYMMAANDVVLSDPLTSPELESADIEAS
jgi:hypothetical protein